MNSRPADCSRNSMLLNRLALSCVLHHGFTWYSGLTVPFLFPKDLFSSQYQQSDSHQTGELERLMLCGRLLREASPSPLCEVIPIWNLTATNAPKNLVCVTGGIRSAILSQPRRRCWNWNPGVALAGGPQLFLLEDVSCVRVALSRSAPGSATGIAAI